jgi:cobalt-zinc-cadmium efflux system protein
MSENDRDPARGAAHQHAHHEAGRPEAGRHEAGRYGGTRVGLAAVSNVAFAVVQVVVGLAIGSVVVLADAAHQTVDALGLLTALVALRIARRPADDVWTYGMGKSDALGGFVSALLLLASVGWLLIESLRRLAEPSDVSGASVMVIGAIAIVVNGAGVLLIGHDHGDDAMSLRAARLHLLTDLAGSVVVVVAGGLLALGGPDWIDPAASLLLCVGVLWTTGRLIRAAAGVLLDRAPSRLTPGDVVDLLATQDGVGSVHHVHVRPLGGGRLSASAHVVVDGARSVHDAQATVERLSAVLLAEHAVTHTTLQLECHNCDDATR